MLGGGSKDEHSGKKSAKETGERFITFDSVNACANAVQILENKRTVARLCEILTSGERKQNGGGVGKMNFEQYCEFRKSDGGSSTMIGQREATASFSI